MFYNSYYVIVKPVKILIKIYNKQVRYKILNKIFVRKILPFLNISETKQIATLNQNFYFHFENKKKT
jgi:hypothetical protein